MFYIMQSYHYWVNLPLYKSNEKYQPLYSLHNIGIDVSMGYLVDFIELFRQYRSSMNNPEVDLGLTKATSE